MTSLSLMNRIHYENRLYPKGARMAKVEVFKRKDLYVSREERRGSKISTFVDTVAELAQEVSRIRAELRKDGVFVIIEIGAVPPDEGIGGAYQPLSEGERNEFVRRML